MPAAAQSSVRPEQTQNAPPPRPIEKLYELLMLSRNPADSAAVLAAQVAAQASCAMASAPAAAAGAQETASIALSLAGPGRTGEASDDSSVTRALLKSSLTRWLEAESAALAGLRTRLDEETAALRKGLDARQAQPGRLAEQAIAKGIRSAGRVRAGYFQDAVIYLKNAAEMASGHCDHTLWFSMGWLRWQAESNLGKAEEAFLRCLSLVAGRQSLYAWLAERHLANIRYLLGDVESAARLADSAATREPAADTLFDAAVYHAAAGHAGEALSLLECCLDLQPLRLYAVLAEPAFAPLVESISSIAAARVSAARKKAGERVRLWQTAQHTVQDALEQAACKADIPAALFARVSEYAKSVHECGYLDAVELAAIAAANTGRAVRAAADTLEAAASARAKSALVSRSRVDQTRAAAQRQCEDEDRALQQAIAAAARKREQDSRPDLGVSWLIAMCSAGITGYLSQDAAKGVAVFLPALAISVLFTYAVSSSSAAQAYNAAVRAARARCEQRKKAIEAEAGKAVSSAQKEYEQDEKLRVAAEKALEAVRSLG